MSFSILDNMLYGDFITEAKHNKREAYLAVLYGFTRPVAIDMPKIYNVNQPEESYSPKTNNRKPKEKSGLIKV